MDSGNAWWRWWRRAWSPRPVETTRESRTSSKGRTGWTTSERLDMLEQVKMRNRLDYFVQQFNNISCTKWDQQTGLIIRNGVVQLLINFRCNNAHGGASKMHHSQAASFHEGQRGSLPCPCPILLQNTQSHLIRVKINFYIHPNKFNDFGLNPTPCLYGGQCDQKKIAKCL